MNVPINIFYHLMLCNHWKEILLEQLADIYESGLYDECTTIYVGCLGSEEDFFELKKIFADHEFTKVEFYHHEDVKQYEFFTLKVLKCVADVSPLFYGFYILNKGVSYPDEPNKTSGKVWRNYMMKWVIKEWRQNYKVMDMKFAGYDICACKVIPKRVSPSGTTHASGNMVAFNSEYIRSLAPVESLNNSNRFEAETLWFFSGEPIIYMPCNLFIDYMNRQTSYDDFAKNYPEFNDYCL